MIQTDTLQHAKTIARLPLGQNAKVSYLYWSDTKRQWESSHSSAKALELIGSQNAPAYSVADTRDYLGQLSSAETQLVERMGAFYGKLARLTSTLPVPLNTEVDALETVLDMRELSKRAKPGCRVLDIGPGSGRNMLGMFLSEEWKSVNYVGVESIGIPYNFQNMAAGLLTLDQPNLAHYDWLDYYFTRKDFPLDRALSPGAIARFPLWEAEILPEKQFDVIICNYLMDEVSSDDFHRIVALIERCLAPNGIVYCRGSQQRAMLANLYLYGYGTYHGNDITAALLSKGLECVHGDLVSSTLTRVFARSGSGVARGVERYAGFREDVPLVREVQTDFIKDNLRQMRDSKARVVVWGDIGYGVYGEYVAPHWDSVNIVGMTHRWVEAEGATPFGFAEVPLKAVMDLKPDAIIFASMRFVSYLREFRELQAGLPGFERIRRFNFPVAFAYKD